MLERTKKRRTDTIKLCFHGPADQREKAVRMLKGLGFVDTTDSIPWREAFPEYTDEDLPGVSLRGARLREDLTQVALSQKTGIPQRHISEMENGKRVIGKKNAQIFANALNVSYKVFL